MGVKISALSAVTTPLAGTETIPAVQTTTKKVTTAQLAAYSIDTLVAASTATPTTGDYILAARSTDEKRLTLDSVSSYVTAKQWTDAAVLTPTLTGDKLLVNRSGTVYYSTIDTLKTFVLDGIQETVQNVSALTAVTLASAVILPVCEGTTAKKTTAGAIADYVHGDATKGLAAYVGALSDATTLAGADKFYVTQSGSGKYGTMTEVATFVQSTIAAAIVASVFDGASGDPVVGTDIVPIERSAVLKSVTATQLSTYVVSVLAAGTALSPAVDATKFVAFDGSTLKTVTADVLATYMAAELFADATATTPALGTHKVLADASGLITLTVDVLKTYILNGVQATVLDIDGLASATLADAQYVPICDGSTGKQTTLSALSTYINGKLGAWAHGLSDAKPVVDTDDFVLERGGTTSYKIAASDLADYVEAEIWDQTADTSPVGTDLVLVKRAASTYKTVALSELLEYMTDDLEAAALAAAVSGWSTVTATYYTSTPADTDTITMSNTTGMEVGLPIKYTISGVTYYGIVSAVVTNDHIDVRGAPLSGTISALYLGQPNRVVVERINIDGAYLVPWYIPYYDADGSGTGDSEADKDILLDIAKRYISWRHADAYLVSMAVTQGTADATAQPKFNVKVGGSAVFNQDSSKGVQVSATPGTWTKSSAVAVATANYKTEPDDALEILCTANGASGEAADISLELVFVLE